MHMGRSSGHDQQSLQIFSESSSEILLDLVQILGMRAWKPAVMALLAANTSLTMIQVDCCASIYPSFASGLNQEIMHVACMQTLQLRAQLMVLGVLVCGGGSVREIDVVKVTDLSMCSMV